MLDFLSMVKFYGEDGTGRALCSPWRELCPVFVAMTELLLLSGF
jgi:hypothetical protein